MNTFHIETAISHQGPPYASETVHVGWQHANCESWEEAVEKARDWAAKNPVNSFSAVERRHEDGASPLVRYRTFRQDFSGVMQDGGEVAR